MILCFCLLLCTQIPFSANAYEGGSPMLHITSSNNFELINHDGNMYYIENRHTLFSHNADLFTCQNGQLSKITHFQYYTSFRGSYNHCILISLVKSNYTNYPENIGYTLYDPSTQSLRDLPKPIMDMISNNDHIVMRAIDNILFLQYENQLLYYEPNTQNLIPVLESSTDFIGFSSTFVTVCCGERKYFIYGVDNHIQIRELALEAFEICLKIPNTHEIYYVRKMGKGYGIYQNDTSCQNEKLILTVSSIDHLMLSEDNYGQFLYYKTKNPENNPIVYRLDLSTMSIDESFEYPMIKINKENEYYVDIIIQNNTIAYIIRREAKNEFCYDIIGK